MYPQEMASIRKVVQHAMTGRFQRRLCPADQSLKNSLVPARAGNYRLFL
jgi:hypothetical protein